MKSTIIEYNSIKDKAIKEKIDDLRKVAETCKALLKDNGATRFNIGASISENNEFNIDGGKFSLFRTVFSNNLGITAYVGNKKGTSSINKFDDENLREACLNAITSAKAAEDDDAWEVAPKQENKIFSCGELYLDEEKLFMRLKEYLETVKKDYPLIMLEQVYSSHAQGVSIYLNSSETEFISMGGSYSLDTMYSAHDGDNSSSFTGDSVSFSNLDTPLIEIANMRKSLEDIQKQIYTESFTGKFVGTLVCPPGLMGEFVGSAIDLFTGDYSILNGTSIWKDKMDTKVADERLTVSFNPTDDRIVGSDDYTGEGYLSEDFDCIKDGVLKSMTISSYVANKSKTFKRAKNNSGSMIITPGEKSIDDIIKSIDKGIIVGRFSGGEPSSNGDFTGVAKNSFLIEKGKITKSLSETMISGNFADLLQNIIDISKDVTMDGGSVLPYISFGGVTISGK